ncbi:hypothetical protein HDV02_003347 [Globomyces sp. JEL0801]|nr:hypothetical protein HDV02_003347 [Globomyces sp. JEL0801]
MKIELEKQDHFGQITALMFLTGNLLLVGTGSFVKLYDINIPNSPLITFPVMNKSRVHNIIKTRLIPNGIELHNPQKNAFHITDSIPLETIMVLGGKTISFLSTHLQLIKTVEFRDWIQCARVLSDGTIAILYSHNFLELWDLNSGLLKSVSLEVRCMLYSGDIFGTSWNTLNVASGTIFNTVLIWSPIDNQNGVARVQQRLNGHEGVIHGVRFNSDGSMICSTSDDRTVRIWKLTGDVLSPMVLYGHLGRMPLAEYGIPMMETVLNVFQAMARNIIMAYDVSKSTAALVSFYEKLHGDDAVTSLAITNTEKLLTVYSVGRDGVFSATQLRPPSSPEKSWVFDKIHSSRITRGWLEKIEIVDDTIYLCGFFDKEFFIFNETKNYQVFKIACGGAHRLWNVHIPNLNLVDFRFGYIRKQRIQLVSKTFNPDRNVLNDILQEPYHCLETRVARIFSMNEVTLVATGGENGVLTFHHILKNVGSSKRIASCRKHTGSIRAIGVISNLSNQNGLLFSGGSVQELKCWRIELSNSSLETENVRMSCNELSSANLCSESVDTRVMDLDAIISITDTQMILVATVNSDTSVVLWCYNVEHNSFTKIDVSHKHLRCLLKCKTLSVTIGNHNRILLFTAGTDGKVILWDISENKLQSVSEWTPHQSGIKALSVAEKNGTIFVLSGGDDNAIVLTTINLQSLSSSCVELDTIRIENGHSSSITGCAITKNLQIITCSIDQRLSVRNMDLQLLSETYIDIADVSDLSILSDFICVVGFGMQIFKIK